MVIAILVLYFGVLEWVRSHVKLTIPPAMAARN